MKAKLANFWFDFFRFPGYMLFHPVDGFEEMKRYKKGKLYVSIVFIALFAVLQIVRFQYKGVLVNGNNPQNLNSILEISIVGAVVFLFVIGNWSITTLMSGKGNLKEILMVTGYAMFPMIVLGFPAVILSNYITLDEVAFYVLIEVISYVGAFWMLFMGLLSIHQYGLGKAILSIFLTIVAMSVLIFLGLLFFDLIRQIISFVSSIFEELRLR